MQQGNIAGCFEAFTKIVKCDTYNLVLKMKYF